MSDLLLIFSLGFLGSFGHCVSMCGPLTVAFSVMASPQRSSAKAESELEPGSEPEPGQNHSPHSYSEAPPSEPRRSNQLSSKLFSTKQKFSSPQWNDIWFHLCLNAGRLLSYTLVGATLGTVGSMVVWSSQLAGVGSDLRRAIALLTGILLIWFGVRHVWPKLLPKIPLSILGQTRIHQWIERVMNGLAGRTHGFKAMLLGMVWGLMPCGFLFAAQLKAIGESDPLQGSLIMLFFGLGTFPSMVGIGVTSSFLSQHRRSQLFRAGGVVAIAIGLTTVLRTGDLMVDYTAYGALICLMLALIARPISRLWPALMHYRRALGVGGFILSVAHVIHRVEHTWNWKLDALNFMPPAHQQGIVLGVISIVLLVPLTLTSFDQAQRSLGSRWRKLHLLSIPALLLAAGHTVMVGSSFLGSFQLSWLNYTLSGVLLFLVVGVLVVRSPWAWSALSLRKFYVLPHCASSHEASTVSKSSSPSVESSVAQCHDNGNFSHGNLSHGNLTGDRPTELRSSNRNS